MTDRETLLRRAADIDWFHAIDFGDCQSPGRFHPGTPQNRTLYGIMEMLGHVDLTGLDCLDIGTADGLVAFNMASRGAARVVATDVPAEGRPSFHTARELLGLDVELITETTFDNILDKVGEHAFDVVVCSGVLYHMLQPFDCILKARKLLKRHGLLLFQTRYHAGEEQATLDFNSVSGKLDRATVFWVPSKTAVTGMLALSGFQTLAVRTGTMHEFLSAIARNVDFDEITGAPGLIHAQHNGDLSIVELLPAIPGESSAARYGGPQDDVVIDDKQFRPDFTPHPTDSKPLVGSSFHKHAPKEHAAPPVEPPPPRASEESA